MKTSKFYLNKSKWSKFNAWLLCAFVIWHILLLKTTSKLSRFTVVKRMMVYNPNPGIHHIIHNFPSSFFFFAPKINWIEPSEIEPIFFNKKIICAAICINVKKMVFSFDKKNPHNSTIYASWVSFWHCKKYHLYHWDTFKCNLQQKVLEKKYHLIKKNMFWTENLWLKHLSSSKFQLTTISVYTQTSV